MGCNALLAGKLIRVVVTHTEKFIDHGNDSILLSLGRNGNDQIFDTANP